jgi:predicted AAA+ superfamily ATPase
MYIEREIKNKFGKIAKVYNVVAIVGARQSGKTTFLKEHSKNLKSSYLLFDDPDIRGLFEEDVKKFEIQNMEGKEISIFDEVQYVKDAGKKLKYLADKGRKIWLTSSSEIILSKEVLSYLVGRVSIIKLYPFSISEFLKLKGQKEFTKKISERNIWEHIIFGGYPKVASNTDIEIKRTILKDLYDTMILKDIARTFQIEYIKSLEDFSRYLSLNIGGLISYENVSRDIKISFQTLKKYLDAMEKSYLIFRVSPFFTNKLKEITKQPKIYFIDTGLRNIIAKKTDIEIDGKLFENYIASELLKLGLQLKYWRTKSKAEVDIILEKDSEIIPIEIKVNSDDNIKRGLRSFIETYKPKKAFVIFYKGNKKEELIEGCRIRFVDILEAKELLEK